jgi:transposase-like protein
MKKAREFAREFKLKALARMEAGENVSELARELKVRRKLLYQWRARHRAGGPEALVGRGHRPPRDAVPSKVTEDALAAAQRRIAELERKVGHQEMELDFFQRALQRVRALPQGPKPGAVRSTKSSRR